MKRMAIGVQLYTLREDMEKDMEGTLRKVAALGYEGVEFAGYYGWEAPRLRQLLDELGLKAIGSHVALANLKTRLHEEIDYLRTLGARYMICPYVMADERQSAADWRGIIDFLGEAGHEVRKRGLELLYHNHEFEFQMQVDGEFAFDAIYALPKQEAVKTEMDICWVQFAGQDPLAYIAKYTGRVPLIHFKDFTKDEEGKIVTLELGLGEVELEKVISAAEQAGVEWLIVEQDRCQKAPMESVSNSLNWVKEHYTQVQH